MIGIYSPGIWRIPHLEKFLAQPCQKLSLLRPVPQEVDAIAVWGHRPSAAKPVAIAKAAGKPVIRLEDGFVRSLDLGVNGEPPLSLVVDDCCIYYDASKPSALEKLVQDKAGNTALISQAREAMHTIVTGDLSKYNLAPAFVADESERSDIVLVVDQTFNDMSVTYGNAGPHEFAAMLEAAMAENPQAEIWVKVHPDVLEGKKTGYFAALRATQRVRLIAENVSPQSLLRHVSRVYVVTSQYGFEALLAGKPVTCFGQPWYAGWGLTDDRHPQSALLSARRGSATLEELFAAAYLRYCRYIDPQTGEVSNLFTVLQWLQLQRRHLQQRNGYLWAPGLTLWKSAILKPFLQTATNRLSFSRRCTAASACVVWGVKENSNGEPKRSENHCRYGEWKMVFYVHPDLALTFCRRYRWSWINAGSTMTPRAPATWKCCLITAS